MNFGLQPEKYIEGNFNNPKCVESFYGRCRKKSVDHVRKWEHILSPHEKKLFQVTPACQAVIKHHGYDDQSFVRRFPLANKRELYDFVKDMVPSADDELRELREAE